MNQVDNPRSRANDEPHRGPRGGVALGRLYAILEGDQLDPHAAEAAAHAAAQGGANPIQLRAKRLSDRDLYALAKALRERLAGVGAQLIVNDHLDVARAAGAAGVHLGDDDLPTRLARRYWPDGWIGRTVRTAEAARRAAAAGADYLGVGAVFRSQTKGSAPVIGLAGLGRVCRATALPVVAIGGIDRATASRCLLEGARAVAVSRALFATADQAPPPAVIQARAARLCEAMENPE